MTALLLLAALASGGEPSRSKRAEPPVIVALGDSTTAGTPAFQSPVEHPPAGLGDITSQYGYWLARRRLGWRVVNRGVNGERTDHIRARFARDVEAARPRIVVILAGVNDVYQDRPLQDAQEDLRWMYWRAKALGIKTVAATILPFDRATPEQSARIAMLNAWIKAVADDEGLVFCDTAAAAASPRDSRRLKGSPDGLHPDPATYRAVGEAVYACLDAD